MLPNLTITTLSSLLLATAIEAQTMTTREAIAMETAVVSVPARERTTTTDTSIRPFRVHVSDEALVDLKRRINSTRSTPVPR